MPDPECNVGSPNTGTMPSQEIPRYARDDVRVIATLGAYAGTELHPG
jgi:hypothetical protein